MPRRPARAPLRWTIAAYVEAIRNTPFLVQIFIIYFSLPALGISVGANEAALTAMVVNFGAYGTEILRAGIESIGQGQIDAAKALGLTRLQTFRHVVLFPALKTVFPALASQFILLMLASSVVSAISAVELTAVTNSLQSTTFRPFEFYFVATGLYLAMALGFRAVLGGIYWTVFMRGRRALRDARVNRTFGIPEFLYILARCAGPCCCRSSPSSAAAWSVS